MRRLKRAEQVTFRRVLYPLALLLSPKIVRLSVCLHIKEIVLVATKPQREACALPKRLEECLALFWRMVESVILSEVVGKSCKAAFTEIEHLRIVWSESILLFL